MKLTGQQFLDQPKKAITLMGMSGVGKSFTSQRLRGWGWDCYSCDYEIGTKYLGEEIVKAISKQVGEPVVNTVTPEDLSQISKYVGQLGNPAKGGLRLNEFKNRQRHYYKAECAAVEDVVVARKGARRHFVHDSTGSLCEIEDEAVLKRLGEQTLIVYIKADEAHNKKVLERARSYPKPLFFPPAKFDEWLAQYMSENDFSSTDEIEPDNFSIWVFPKLFESRLPKYQGIADKYGVTISSGVWGEIGSEDDLVNVIAGALG